MASEQAVEAGHSDEEGPSTIVETEDHHPLKEYGGKIVYYFNHAVSRMYRIQKANEDDDDDDDVDDVDDDDDHHHHQDFLTLFTVKIDA